MGIRVQPISTLLLFLKDCSTPQPKDMLKWAVKKESMVLATLENTISAGTNWADLTTSTFTGSETAPVPVNFNGVFSYIRFKASANPTTAISKILVRN